MWANLFSEMSMCHCKTCLPFLILIDPQSVLCQKGLDLLGPIFLILIYTHMGCDFFTDLGKKPSELSTDVIKGVLALSQCFSAGNSYNCSNELNPISANCICVWGIRWGHRIARRMERTEFVTTAISEQKQTIWENSVVLDCVYCWFSFICYGLCLSPYFLRQFSALEQPHPDHI